MQSSFKPRPPSFIEEIQRDLRATTMQTDHIIFRAENLYLGAGDTIRVRISRA
jgi:hypothetical protein